MMNQSQLPRSASSSWRSPKATGWSRSVLIVSPLFSVDRSDPRDRDPIIIGPTAGGTGPSGGVAWAGPGGPAAMPDRRPFLTDPDDFTDVSRGQPIPHTLK